MQKRTRAIAITASMTVAGVALGATIATAASGSKTPPHPALQSTTSRYVFACVNPEGGIDYLEFRAPLPHQCWFAGESLWYWDAVPLAGAATTPSPTPTPTVSPTPTATATDAPLLANIETTALNYTASSAATPLTTAMTLTDSDGSMITSATVSITAGFSSTADTLSFATANGITGNYNTSTGVLTLTGSATAATYQAALQSVKFASTATTAGTRTVSFAVTDADSETSNTETRSINVTT
jgi:hypothetical protein